MTNDNKSLAHTKWNCKYHIVFAPKYRRKEFFGEKRAEIGRILRQLCEWKGIEIHEAEVCPDHVHMLVSIPPKVSVSGFNMVHTISLYEVCSKRYLDLEVQPGRLKNEFQAICNLMDRYAYGGSPHFHC